MAVVGGHIGGKDNQGYGQSEVQRKRTSTDEVKVLIVLQLAAIIRKRDE